jgi:hypothetical protein
MRFLVALALTVAVAGCGLAKQAPKSKFQGTKGDVATAISNLSKAAKAQDKSRICNELITTALATSLGGRTHCTDTIANVLDDTDPAALSMTVKTVTLGPGRRPTTATATVKSGSGKNAVNGSLPLVKQGSTWRISGFG